MEKLLMLGTSYGSREIIRYAKSQGIYTIVTDYLSPDKSLAKKIADEYWMINTADLDALEKRCKEENITAIICGVSEFNLEMTMALCHRLGFPCYCTPSAWHFSRNKADFKELCKRLNAPIPTDYIVTDALSEEELNKVQFPVMCKPVDMSGNRGISYCYTREDLISAYKYARSLSKNSKIIVERMLHGQEWWAGYAIAGGDIRLIALNGMYAQPGEPKNCYTITTTATNHVEKFIHEINPKIEEVLKEVGCNEGYAWVQVMLDKDGHFYIIEMGYRLSGELIYQSYKDLCGCDVIKMLVDYSRGLDVKPLLPSAQKHAFRKIATGISLWTNKGGVIKKYLGMEELNKLPNVKVDILAQVGDSVDPYRGVGCISIINNDIEELISTIDMINNTIHVINERGEDIVIKYTDYNFLRTVYTEGLEGR